MGIKFDYNVVVAIDLDGTLTKSDNYPNQSYEFNLKAVNWAKRIKSLGVIIILWTCGNEHSLIKKIKELKNLGLEFDYINEYSTIRGNTRKINADFYIDDRANDQCIKWNKIYKKIKKLKKLYSKFKEEDSNEKN